MLVLEWLAELGEIGLIISHWEWRDGVCARGGGGGTDSLGFAAPQFWDFDRFKFSIYHLPPPIFAILVNRSKKWKLVM